jgi:DNA end-binding protein Ku
MRSMWAGAVSFGLVSIPVRLYPAAAPWDPAFRQVHTDDGGRISFRRVGPVPDDDPGESARAQEPDLAGALRASLDLARARRRSAPA